MPVTILVAEDSVTMRRIVEMTFAGEKDIRVVTVASGDAALQKAAEVHPDIVFADSSMAGMDGYELARAIKSDGALSGAAVILMASQKNPYDDARAKACGVDDHIIKPYDSQHVIDRVQQVLGRPRAQAAGGAPVAKPAAVPMSSPMAATVPNAPAPVLAGAAARPSPVGLDSPVAKPAAPAAKSAPIAPMAPARPAAPAPKASPAAAATAPGGDLAGKLAGLGLNTDQVAGVLTLSREVIEQVVWEVVPDLAEAIIREEIARLTAE